MDRFRWFLIALLLASATACTGTPKAICPEPVIYSEKEQRDAAAELRQLQAENKAPTLRRWIVDYGQERAKLRACQ